MKTVAQQVEDYFEGLHQKGATSGRNNHFYWAGFAVMAAGIAADDREPLQLGQSAPTPSASTRFRPTARCHLKWPAASAHCTIISSRIAPLVTMAELAQANGDDLYAYDHSRLKLLVSRQRQLASPTTTSCQEKSGVAQDTPKDGLISASDISWLAPYARRFPSPEITALLQAVPAGPTVTSAACHPCKRGHLRGPHSMIHNHVQ